ncbi:MAG: sulfatase [Bacteroidetes bacterium]|nr:sulfatase [Bacteroidota bacterium]
MSNLGNFARGSLYLPLLLVVASCSTKSITAPPTPPNVVIMFVDDMGYGDTGVYGLEAYATPNLDRMASEGVYFTDFYVSQAVCSASRASLLTGNYANRIGIHGALGPGNTHGINKNEVTLGELFKEKGYATAVYGKWHLGHHPDFLPLEHGFDDFYGIPYSNDMWPFHPENPDAWGDLPTIERDSIVGYNTDQTRFTTDFTRRSTEFIQSQVSANRPFFLYIAHPMPHVPLFVSKERSGLSGAGLYGDVIHEIDWSIGEILKTLQETEVDDNTLVLFASDNGPWLSYGNHAGSTGDLREGKGTAWEGGVRVPFIARWPNVIPEGITVNTPAMTIDLFPTLAHLINAPLPEHPIDGRNIWPLMTGKSDISPQKAYFFWYKRNELHAVRSGRWKLYFPHSYRTMKGQSPGADGIPGKYISRDTNLELYDLVADIGEYQDLSSAYPEIVDQLSALADSMREVLGDQLRGIEGSQIRQPGRVDSSSYTHP